MWEISIDDFLDELSSRKPTPGGGSVSALLGALCCALGNMVCSLTVGKKKYSAYDAENRKSAARLEQIKDEFRDLYGEDIRAFERLVVTYKLPAETEEQRACKADVMRPLLLDAIDVPMRIMQNCVSALECLDELKDRASALVISDIGVAAACARACLESAVLNVWINTAALDEKRRAEEINRQAGALLDKGVCLADQVYAQTGARLQK